MPPISVPVPLATHNLLSSFHHHPTLPKHTFYFIASVAFSILNRPEEIPRVWNYALNEVAIRGSADEDYVRRELSGGCAGPPPARGDGESALTIHRKIREALLKSAAIGGLPKAINALNLLKNSTPAHILAAPSPTKRRQQLLAHTAHTSSSSSSSTPDSPTPTLQVIARGNTFFDKVYGKVSKRVMGSMRNSYDDLGVVAELLYGHVFSETEVLGARDTSLLLVAGLIPQNVNPQLKGHLKGALNNGAEVVEVMAVREVVLKICREAGWRGEETEVARL